MQKTISIDNLNQWKSMNSVAAGLSYKPKVPLDVAYQLITQPFFNQSANSKIELNPNFKFTNPDLEKLRKNGTLTIKSFYETVFKNIEPIDEKDPARIIKLGEQARAMDAIIPENELAEFFRAVQQDQQAVQDKNQTSSKVTIVIGLLLSFAAVGVYFIGGPMQYALIAIGAGFGLFNLSKMIRNLLNHGEKELNSYTLNKGEKVIAGIASYKEFELDHFAKFGTQKRDEELQANRKELENKKKDKNTVENPVDTDEPLVKKKSMNVMPITGLDLNNSRNLDSRF